MMLRLGVLCTFQKSWLTFSESCWSTLRNWIVIFSPFDRRKINIVAVLMGIDKGTLKLVKKETYVKAINFKSGLIVNIFIIQYG
jgi:hypothetical protein